LLEKLRKLRGGEGPNREVSAWDELGMGSKFEYDLGRKVRYLPLDGGRVRETNDVRVLLIDGEPPRAFGTEHLDNAFTQAIQKRTADVGLTRAKHLGKESRLLGSR
jgi:hypothetical protein